MLRNKLCYEAVGLIITLTHVQQVSVHYHCAHLHILSFFCPSIQPSVLALSLLRQEIKALQSVDMLEIAYHIQRHLKVNSLLIIKQKCCTLILLLWWHFSLQASVKIKHFWDKETLVSFCRSHSLHTPDGCKTIKRQLATHNSQTHRVRGSKPVTLPIFLPVHVKKSQVS